MSKIKAGRLAAGTVVCTVAAPSWDPTAQEVTVVGENAPSAVPEASAILAQQTVIQEMDHRIKNHLQLLASYARIASRRRGLTAGELAEDLADKLFAVARAHDALHQAHGRGFGLARPFLQTLVDAFAGSPQQIVIECDADLQLPAAELAPVGMIVSEAIANALKHAFPGGQEGKIWVVLVLRNGRVSLTIRDDGVGMRDVPDERISGRGLIETLAQQLGGHAQFSDAPLGGALVNIAHPHAS